jgi:hypothetical protein
LLFAKNVEALSGCVSTKIIFNPKEIKRKLT